MTTYQPLFQIAKRPGESTYLALARHLVEEIRRGRLLTGTKLPGTRTLAAQLDVSRNTVLNAYDELLSQGLLETRQAKGTFVAQAIPEPLTRRQRTPAITDLSDRPGFALGSIRGLPDAWTLDTVHPGTLASGMPDNRLIPVDLLARAYRRVLKQRGNALLGYGDPRGELSLRKELARMFSATRGLPVSSDNVLITRGAQMALSLAARVLVRPGDRVAVERYGYEPLWDTLRIAGAELVPVPVDASGMQVQKLAELGKLRAVYVTPHHQYPTTALLAADRRSWLLKWAKNNRCAILEDDYDHEFQFRGQPVLPLMSADRAAVVLYIGGLSKVLAPGIRIGCLVASEAVIGRAARLRQAWDRQGDQPTEAAVAELMRTGEITRHIRRVRKVYGARQQALLQALGDHMPDCFEIPIPAGGMAIWARIIDGTDPERWAANALKRGIEITTARRFDIHKRRAPFLRIGFAANTETEIRAAVRIMADCKP